MIGNCSSRFSIVSSKLTSAQINRTSFSINLLSPPSVVVRLLVIDTARWRKTMFVAGRGLVAKCTQVVYLWTLET